MGAHHEKNVIVRTKDGLQAFCGGMDINKNRVISKLNIGERWFPYYHDTACRVDGLAAWEMLQRFKRRWQNHPQAKSTSLRGANEPKPKEAAAPQPFVQVVGTYNSPDGKEKDRSFSEAFFKVIENAEKYIYIEDQYMVNLDVARVLNKAIKKPKFERLTLAIQASDETADILIPNRKERRVLPGGDRRRIPGGAGQGAAGAARQALLGIPAVPPGHALQDADRGRRDRHHRLGNVNQRSFTNDSETSALVFDDGEKADAGFAYRFRSALFKHYYLTTPSAWFYEQWRILPALHRLADRQNLMLVKYTQDNLVDLDERIIDKIKSSGVLGAAAILHITGNNLQATSMALSPFAIRGLFDQLFDTFIDPKAD